jgi:ribosomal protein S18 acetylase RimI-like enzyme
VAGPDVRPLPDRFARGVPLTLRPQVRDAGADEAPALEALQRRSSGVWVEYRAQLAAHPEVIEVPDDALREGRVRVAVDDAGRRLGFSVVEPVDGRTCELDGLFVEPEHMRAGLGRLLVADVVARGRAQRVERLDVVANPRAVGFYERVGFRRGAEVPTRFGSALRMHLDL